MTSSWGGSRYAPNVFTEQGVYMLMTILKGGLAAKQSRDLVLTFKKMKDIYPIAEDNEIIYIGSELPSEYAGSVYTKKLKGADAKNGWYRYDTRFALPVYGDDGNIERYNIFRGRLLIRHVSSGKKYLYDILEIKKETGKSCQT